MIKLYKMQDGILHYWETWDRPPKSGLIHWGIVGERGAKKIVRATGALKYQATIQAEIEGFAEVTKEYLLEIEYEAKTINPNRSV